MQLAHGAAAWRIVRVRSQKMKTFLIAFLTLSLVPVRFLNRLEYIHFYDAAGFGSSQLHKLAMKGTREFSTLNSISSRRFDENYGNFIQMRRVFGVGEKVK